MRWRQGRLTYCKSALRSTRTAGSLAVRYGTVPARGKGGYRPRHWSAPPPAVVVAPRAPAQVVTDTVYVEDERDRDLRAKMARHREKWERELLHDRDELQQLLREEQRLDRIILPRGSDACG